MAGKYKQKILLPDGWIAKVSRSNPGKMYYVNKTLKISSWTLPEWAPQKIMKNSSNLPSKYSKVEKRSSDTLFADQNKPNDPSQKKFCSTGFKKVNDSTLGSVPKKQGANVKFNITASERKKNFQQKKKNFDSKMSLNKNCEVTCGSFKNKTFCVSKSNATNKVNVQHSNKTSSNLKCTVDNPIISKPLGEKLLPPTKNFGNVNKLLGNKASDNLVHSNSFIEKEQADKARIKKQCLISTPHALNNDRTALVDNHSTSLVTEADVTGHETVEDVEMLDLSMNFLIIDNLLVDESSSFYIVLDTNVFIYELAQIDEIKDVSIKNNGFPHIVVPWIVIQELDKLRKRPTESSEIHRKAHEGIKYINRMIKGKHPRFHGQSPKEMKESAQPFSNCNDDLILECCLNLAQKMAQDKVILITNDINLSTKAMISNITAHNVKSFMDFTKVDEKDKSGKRVCLESDIHKNAKVKPLTTVEILPISEQKSSDEHPHLQEIHTLMTKARFMLKDVLCKLIKIEMDEAYGDVWVAFKLDMTSLQSIFKAIDKYWKCVFSFHFNQRDLCNFKFLQGVSESVDGFLCKAEKCLEILTAIEKIFISIKKAWSVLEVPLENIRNSHLTCVELLAKKNSNENGSPSSLFLYEAVFNLFQHNWATINHLCGITMDFCDLPHEFIYEKPSVFPSEKEFENLMCNLYPSVKLIKTYMSKTVIKNPHASVLDIEFYRKFFKALCNFIPSLNIKAPPFDSQQLNVLAFYDFCRDPSKQETLLLGYKQLECFENKLEEALRTMVSLKKNIASDKMICD
ncbi:transcriptional protein SWT1 [Parasteatoda tepidariorum]|uniref:transcriptional protein SWT1 n=1 Tax=Parasteatoda tepidariorum TaxID=114398 RepID=UPI001C721E81|nr:transcriptional protein SWT1 [Parasteatoda tepidariorum]XP_015912883.2 transcriptional protein SWT1 [Parasteatoda tepidariorum]XP_015912884.2 transcriptional protein SWT1 [Parasteatoda tepidariorum]